MKHTYLILSLSFILAGFACKETPTEGGSPFIRLTAEDIGVTDAYVRLGALIPGEVREVRLLRGETVIFQANALPADTVLLVDSLLHNQAYTLTAELRTTGDFYHTSSPLTFTTMDTTSHNFTWQIDTLGDGGGSVLYDVAIINDTLAYAVGEIYKRDSLGNWDPQPYGLAIWNGRTWSLRKIMVVSQQGDVHSRVLRGVYAFSSSDVWFGDGNAFHWDGQSLFATAYWISGYPGNPTPVLGPNQGVHKFWGTSSSNLYGVGVNGGIAHYDGMRWRRLESGTELDVYDVWGSKNPATGEYEIYAVAAKQFVTFEKKIMKITPSGVMAVPDSGIPYSIHGIWFKGKGPYYIVGSVDCTPCVRQYF